MKKEDKKFDFKLVAEGKAVNIDIVVDEKILWMVSCVQGWQKQGWQRGS